MNSRSGFRFQEKWLKCLLRTRIWWTVFKESQRYSFGRNNYQNQIRIQERGMEYFRNKKTRKRCGRVWINSDPGRNFRNKTEIFSKKGKLEKRKIWCDLVRYFQTLSRIGRNKRVKTIDLNLSLDIIFR